MTGGRGDAPLPPAANEGEFLLSLIQKPHQQPVTTPQPPLLTAPTLLSPQQQQQQQQQQQSLALDPAIAAVGPSIAFRQPQWPSNGRDPPPSLTNPPWPHNLFPPLHPNFVGYPQFPVNHFPANPFMGNQRLLADDLHKLGFPGNANYAIHNLVQHDKQEPQQLLFGYLPHNVVRRPDGLLNGSLSDNSKFSPKDSEREPRNRQLVNSNTNSNLSQNSSQNRSFDSCEPERRGGAGTGGWAKHHHNGNHKSTVPPGFSGKQRGGNWDSASNNGMSRWKSSGYNVDKEKGAQSKVSDRAIHLNGEEERLGRLSIEDGDDVGLTGQLDHPGPSSGNSLQSVPASDIEESLLDLHREVLENRDRKKPNRDGRLRREDEEVADSLLAEDEADGNDEKKQHRQSREKESRIDSRGQWLLSQRMRNLKRQMVCRGDIDGLNAPFLAIYESLVPTEEERAKQKHLLALLEKLVCKEWPGARLYLYGSCANSFGVSKSDIDVCLAVEDLNLDKSEILLKLADILKSDNLQNVQALTRARVPIVKLMDPATGISCDICINNVLAVVNTKLLRDYARIDARLHQLAFIVKHWAKSRGVNQTYQGTLSSYAYVLMCIHFLQQRQPAILPCLQGMETTYSVTVDDIECSYFDQVERLRNFGSYNKETTAQLVWAFFNYWAYGHDYANAVISVRTGSILSKREKDWTRRIGNDRHLICIEDPFEISHDLGRVVDKYSIKVLREEFERAADIMQHDPNPCVTLFEPYVPS